MTTLAEAGVLHAVNEFGIYCIPASYKAREVPQILMKGKVYEVNTLRLIRRLAGSGDVISGGAFIGDFFPAICGALAPKARLHSFEPAPLSFAACTETMRLNALSAVALHPVAVGAEAGALPLQIAKDGGEAMAARAHIAQTHVEGSTIMVEVTTLDALVPKTRKVSVLHLDIEGFEAAALRGAQRIIAHCRPTIILEAARPAVQAEYAGLLAELHPDAGYGLAGVMERNAVFVPSLAP